MASENNLNAVFTDIANAIRDKKGSVDTIKPINMADEILTIETGGGKSTIYKVLEAKGTDWSNAFYVYTDKPNVFKYMTELKESDFPPSSSITNMNNLFYYCSSLITIPQLDTSSCTNMGGFFYGCSSLTSIPQLDTSKATNIGGMFGFCKKLTSIPQLDTSKATNMNNLFYSCSSLTTIQQLDTSSCTSMASIFYGCSSLTSIPQLDTSKATNMGSMFYNCYLLEKIDITKLASGTSYNAHFANSCYSLKTLIIRTMDTIPTLKSDAFTNCYHFYGTTDSTYNPNGLKDGRIYVPDDKVETLKTTTNWSVFADIIKPLSEYVE